MKRIESADSGLTTDDSSCSSSADTDDVTAEKRKVSFDVDTDDVIADERKVSFDLSTDSGISGVQMVGYVKKGKRNTFFSLEVFHQKNYHTIR